jgi:dolichyl-phosphate beta-glucosyltransferase
MTKIDVSIVLPAFEEGRRIAACIEQLLAFSGRLGLEHEILVVVEESGDDTLRIARALGRAPLRVIDNGAHRGKGHAVRSGMLLARGELVVFMDVDLSTPLEEVERFARHMREHPEVDLLIGDRERTDRGRSRQSRVRHALGKLFSAFVGAFAIRGVPDTQCGFKMFRRRAIPAIFGRQTLDGFSFDVEVLLLASRLGMTRESLPVRWKDGGRSTVRLVRDGLGMLWDLARVRRIVDEDLSGARPPS